MSPKKVTRQFEEYRRKTARALAGFVIYNVSRLQLTLQAERYKKRPASLRVLTGASIALAGSIEEVTRRFEEHRRETARALAGFVSNYCSTEEEGAIVAAKGPMDTSGRNGRRFAA